MWPRNVNVKWLHGGPNTPYGFTWPESFTQNREPAIFELTDHTKSIARVSRLIGIEATPRKITFESRVGSLCGLASAQAEGFSFESFD